MAGGVGTAEFSEGLPGLFKLFRLLRLEPGTPVTAEGNYTGRHAHGRDESGGENMLCDDRGLTFMRWKKGKLLVDREAEVRPLAAQLLYEYPGYMSSWPYKPVELRPKAILCTAWPVGCAPAFLHLAPAIFEPNLGMEGKERTDATDRISKTLLPESTQQSPSDT